MYRVLSIFNPEPVLRRYFKFPGMMIDIDAGFHIGEQDLIFRLGGESDHPRGAVRVYT